MAGSHCREAGTGFACAWPFHSAPAIFTENMILKPAAWPFHSALAILTENMILKPAACNKGHPGFNISGGARLRRKESMRYAKEIPGLVWWLV